MAIGLFGGRFDFSARDKKRGQHHRRSRAQQRQRRLLLEPLEDRRVLAIAYNVPAGTVGNQAFGGSLGMDFNVNQPIVITELGVFDSGSDGITAGTTLNAQLFNRGTTAGASPILSFTNASQGALVAGSRFKPLATPILLPAGFLGTMVDWGHDANEPNGNEGTGPLGLTTDDGGGLISFVGSGRFNGTPGAFPDGIDGGPANRYAAGTFVFEAAVTTVALSGADLTITDTTTGGKNDRLTVRFDSVTSEFVISDPNFPLVTSIGGATGSGTNTVRVPAAAFAGSIAVTTGTGDDFLTIDHSTGLITRAISYNGGSQTASPGDGLAVRSAGAAITSNPNAGAGAANFGTVQVAGAGLVSYQNIEPLDLDGGGGIVSIPLVGGDDVLTVQNGLDFATGLLAAIRVSGTSGGLGIETHAVRNASELRIITTALDGNDTITLNAVTGTGGAGVASLTIDTGAGADMIDVNNAVTFAGGVVTLDSQQIDFGVGGVITAASVVLDAGTGSITDGDAGSDVVATNLTATATTGISLDTSIVNLTASNLGAGAISIDESSGITLTSITNSNGPIVITTGGTTIVTSVVSTTDVDANDISIIASAGDMTVTTVTAGAGAAADVTLQASAGSVLDDGILATIVIADVLSITALRDIGAPGAGAIDSTANSLVAATTGGPFALPPTPGIWVNDTNSITVTSATTVDGVIILDCLTGTMTVTSVNANGAGRNVLLRALDGDLIGSFIRSGGGSVTLNAEDNFSLLAGSLTQAATTVSLTSLDGVDVGGSTFNFAGDVDATLMTLTGLGEADTFIVRPDGDGPGGDVDTPISILGAAPVVAPGDVLNLDVAGLGVPTLLLGPGANNGIYSFAAAASVTYNSIETVNSGGGAVNVVLDMQFEGFQDVGADTDTIFVRLDAAGTNLLIAVHGVPVFQGADATNNSLTIIGSDDDDVLRNDETAGGLPRFAGQTPAIDNTGVGGGIANPSHLNPSTDLVLETLFAAGTPWNASDVTIHFAGRTGTDSIELNLITAHQTAYASDTLDGANSGNLGTAGGLGPDFLMSFANLAPLNLNGAGGQLLVDATSTPATSLLTLSDDGAAGDGWSQIAGNGGFETTRFRDYDQLFLVGGDGAELIDMVGLDSASSLLNVTIQGGNTADLLGLGGGDVGNDTIRVRSTLATTPVVVDADAGDDLVQLFDAASTVDNILANVNVNGGSDNNTLTVVDSGDVSSDTVFITQNTIEGNTGFVAGSPDVNYSNIDILNLTATAASDVIDATFAPGSDLDTVNLSGWTGADQFYLSTTDEQIGGTATGIGVINLFGDAPGNPNNPDGNDIFGETPASLIPGTPQGLGVRMIRNSISTLINIDGGQPTAAPNPPVEDQVGDILNLDVSALLPPVIVATLGANNSLPGVAQSIAVPPSHQPVNFIQIEDINLVDGGILTDVEMGDLYIRGTNNADSVNFLATTDPLVPRVRVNAYQNYFRVTRRAVVYGRGGNDNIQMGNFNHPAEFYGEAGDDYLTGYLSSDKLVGGQGRDRINASHGNNVVWGDSDPVEVGLPDIEANRQLMASIGSGSRLEALDADILSTLDGNDTMYGGPGPDSMTLGGGTDWAYGGQGNDSIALGAGDDRGYGGLGNDTITGSGGNDLINGGEGNDSVSGDQGLDVVIGGGGNDAVNGGDGNDLLFDGRVTYTGVSADSQTIGDANDVAMAALLADWATIVPGTLSGAFTNDRDGVDQVRGNGGADSFSADAADILDFELGLDTILP